MTLIGALAWAVDTIRDTSLVTDPTVCERLEECDRLLDREDDEGPDQQSQPGPSGPEAFATRSLGNPDLTGRV